MITEKELAAYLPYGLKWTLQNLKEFEMGGLRGSTLYTTEGSVLCWKKHDDLPQALFPYLFPLSSLTKEITINGETFVPMEKIKTIYPNTPQFFEYVSNWIRYYCIMDSICEYVCVVKLLEWKFDIFNMIERGDAIAISENFNPYK